MVTPLRKNTQENIHQTVLYPTEGVKWTSIKLSEVAEQKYRFEANVFNIESKHAREIIKHCNLPLKSLGGVNGFTTSYHRPRFKRIFLSKSQNPIYQPSQIMDLNPKPGLFISDLTNTNIEQLKVREGQILMTCSGTIGRCTVVSKTLADKIFSHDLLRIKVNDPIDLGFIYSFFRTKIGQILIKTNNYGAVISHIEPEHLSNIQVPNPSDKLKSKINDIVRESFRLRDESNELIESAQNILIAELDLPPIEEIKKEFFLRKDDIENFTVRAKNLSNRFDGSYHHPIVKEIIKLLQKKSKEIKLLGDSELSSNIVLPGRFKRIYVEEENGIKFLGGSEMFQLDPSTDKYLSIFKFNKKIQDELTISKNSLVVSSRGTIGKVLFPPKHFYGWAISDNLMKIEIQNDSLRGYLYAYLSSDYGEILIKRQIYGGVVFALEPHQLAKVEVPMLKDSSKMKEINDLVLKANDMRSQAYNLEQEAIKIVNEEVIYQYK